MQDNRLEAEAAGAGPQEGEVCEENELHLGRFFQAGPCGFQDCFYGIISCGGVLAFAESHLKTISAVHIKGDLNIRADFLSRQSEWQLNPKIFFKITALWGTLQVDLFATRHNRQVKDFLSLNPADRPLAVDALSQTSKWDLAYAFPPLALIPSVIRKIKEDRATVILIAPFWPRRARFSCLRTMSLTDPWVLPEIQDLLSQGLVLHPDVRNLYLTAWLLKG
ncbi:uncharacterized protein LOC130284934 isoform X2 [Hyla sarda]|uniref:uncharacterized protein LOC130284934 isoform X2 n=1 Tax=Hyla sarda TaxID=327740 RepID=UPI0024C36240|nr:uncharacterized protein LOC130284934 isoform X2 [Hyla sarda]